MSSPTKDQIKQACELLNAIFSDYLAHRELADYAATLISDTTLMSVPGIRADLKGRTPDVKARIVGTD